MSKIRLHGSSSGYTEIAPVAASGNNTLTLPNDGTIISQDSNGAVGVTSITVGTGVTIGDGRVTCTTVHGSAASLTQIPAANIVGVCTAGLTKSGGGFGSVLQVVSDTKTDTQSFQSQNFQTISGLSVDITPSSSSNKVLVHYSISVSCNNYGMFNLRRGGTEIFRGDADSNRTQCTFHAGNHNQYETQICSGTFLDSPSSTSSLTYDFQCATPDSSGSQLFINRYKTDTDSSFVARSASTITVMEISA